MKSKIEFHIEHDGVYCYGMDGVLRCPFLGTRKFGGVYLCRLFLGKDVRDDGRLHRLPECIEATAPCPECGGPVETLSVENYRLGTMDYATGCCQCDLYGPCGTNTDEAISLWVEGVARGDASEW